MKELNVLLNQIESYIPYCERFNSDVSTVSVGWQLEHALLVLDSVSDTLEASNTSDYKFIFKPIRYVIMNLKTMPRGKGKSPDRVRPINEFDEKSLQEHLKTTRSKVEKLKGLDKRKYFAHPYFGNIKLNSAIKFLGIHTKHHLKIVADIINQ